MTSEQIENFLTEDALSKVVTISFKTRNTQRGYFIKGADFDELKVKNLWRVLSESKMEEFKKTKSMNLVKIFNGGEFTKLTTKKLEKAVG